MFCFNGLLSFRELRTTSQFPNARHRFSLLSNKHFENFTLNKCFAFCYTLVAYTHIQLYENTHTTTQTIERYKTIEIYHMNNRLVIYLLFVWVVYWWMLTCHTTIANEWKWIWEWWECICVALLCVRCLLTVYLKALNRKWIVIGKTFAVIAHFRVYTFYFVFYFFV